MPTGSFKREVQCNRRRARELALRTLYAYEIDPNDPWQEMLDRIARIAPTDDDSADVSEKIRQYASKVVDSTIQNMAAIDEMISQKAANWELRRMAAVDRNVMRMAAAELSFFDETVPYKVVIDEAVEIAKAYGTDDSGKFVNGILDSIRKDVLNLKT